MTSIVDICNRSLQVLGTRTTVTLTELNTNASNEAIQFNLIYLNMRDDLLRKAPWNCATKVANLTYITSQPGTPENLSASTTLWSPGQPSPPWAYEYQYPVDCLRPINIIPATQTGFSGGVPITTAVTGGATSYWWGNPIRYRVQTDNFFGVTAAAISAGGTGHAVGDLITLALVPNANSVTNLIGTFNANSPQGAAVTLQVASIGGGGSVATVNVINQINGEATPIGGSYFYLPSNPVAQGTTTGAGTGATFNLTFGTPTAQRVILTNQEFATLGYISQITDPNLMDSLFQTAWIHLIASALCVALKENSTRRANDLIKIVNSKIEEARTADANEGLIINDVTPDFIRVRGNAFTEGLVSGPFSGYDFGNFYPFY